MLAYKPATVREQKIINSLNRPVKPQANYNSEWHITAEDITLMLASSTIFAFLIVFLV
jgi:hypothetical protein